jgi:hypothetical protein
MWWGGPTRSSCRREAERKAAAARADDPAAREITLALKW